MTEQEAITMPWVMMNIFIEPLYKLFFDGCDGPNVRQLKHSNSLVETFSNSIYGVVALKQLSCLFIVVCFLPYKYNGASNISCMQAVWVGCYCCPPLSQE